MITNKEILNVISGLSPDEAAAEIKRMIDEEIEFIINSITLHIEKDYKKGDTKKALKDYYMTVNEINSIIAMYNPASKKSINKS